MESRSKTLSVLILLLLSLFALFASPVDADDVTVSLLKDDGTPFDQALFQTTLYFDTDNDDNNTTFRLSAGTEINKNDNANLIINSNSGFYYLIVTATNVQGIIGSTGLVVELQNGNDWNKSTLSQTGNYSGYLVDESNKKVVLSPNTAYPLKILTANDFQSTDEPTRTASLSLTFSVEPAEGYFSVQFMDGDDVVSVKIVKDGDPIGDMPSMDPREGRPFIGWFTQSGTKIETTDIIRSNLILHAEWQDKPANRHIIFHPESGSTLVIHETDLADNAALQYPTNVQPPEDKELRVFALADGTEIRQGTLGSQLPDVEGRIYHLYPIWSDIPVPPEPEPEPPEPEPIPPEIHERTIEDVENPDGSTTEIITDTTKYSDGSSIVTVREYTDYGDDGYNELITEYETDKDGNITNSYECEMDVSIDENGKSTSQ